MEVLIKTLEYLSKTYDLKVSIKDFTYLFIKEKPFSKLQRYTSHINSYCMLVKSTRESFRYCVTASHKRLAEKIAETAGAEEGFWGICHGGVMEYVIPLYYDKILIGAMLAGIFPCCEERAESSFRRLCSRFGLDGAALREEYYQNFKPRDFDEEVITTQLRLCARYLEKLIIGQVDISFLKKFLDENYYLHEKQNLTISYAFEYINNNLGEKITIRDIAEKSYCSESTLSHLFSRMFGMGVGEYITHARISAAKRLLRETNKSIAEISEECGFCYPAYFSNTFKKHTRQTAREYRSGFANRIRPK